MTENVPQEAQPVIQIKHDWYQTEDAVIITLLIKNVEDNQLKVEFIERIVKVYFSLPDHEKFVIKFNLAHKVVSDQCSYKITPSKIEIKLKKQEGLRWNELESELEEVVFKSIPINVAETSGPPAYPTSKKGKDWSAIEKDLKNQEAQEKPEGEEALNRLFQKIYGDGNDEVKKAMNKSFMESGGTVLSTNWSEIGKQKVDVKPPDGMEFKKWTE